MRSFPLLCMLWNILIVCQYWNFLLFKGYSLCMSRQILHLQELYFVAIFWGKMLLGSFTSLPSSLLIYFCVTSAWSHVWLPLYEFLESKIWFVSRIFLKMMFRFFCLLACLFYLIVTFLWFLELTYRDLLCHVHVGFPLTSYLLSLLKL